MPADEWIRDHQLHAVAEVYEHAAALPTIDATLSLLWIPVSEIAPRYSGAVDIDVPTDLLI